MAKVSPMLRSFNAGEFSALLDGRVDLDRYPASAHKMLNAVAAPQGPAICRSGTAYVHHAYGNQPRIALIPPAPPSPADTSITFACSLENTKGISAMRGWLPYAWCPLPCLRAQNA